MYSLPSQVYRHETLQGEFFPGQLMQSFSFQVIKMWRRISRISPGTGCPSVNRRMRAAFLLRAHRSHAPPTARMTSPIGRNPRASPAFMGRSNTYPSRPSTENKVPRAISIKAAIWDMESGLFFPAFLRDLVSPPPETAAPSSAPGPPETAVSADSALYLDSSPGRSLFLTTDRYRRRGKPSGSGNGWR